MVKEFLSREGHPFVVKSIEDDDAAFDELVKLGAGRPHDRHRRG